MHLVSVTRLRLKSVTYLPQFLIANEAAITAIKRIVGFVSGKELVDKEFTFWTVTVWTSAEAMQNVRNCESYRNVMGKLPFWCDEGAYAHWMQDGILIPEWQILYQKLIAEGKRTKVRQPSAQQLKMSYPPPLWTKVERLFKSGLKT